MSDVRNPVTGKLYPASHCEVLRALAAPKRKPTEADAPPATPFPGKRIRPTPGQLDVFGNEVQP